MQEREGKKEKTERGRERDRNANVAIWGPSRVPCLLRVPTCSVKYIVRQHIHEDEIHMSVAYLSAAHLCSTSTYLLHMIVWYRECALRQIVSIFMEVYVEDLLAHTAIVRTFWANLTD